MTLTRNLAPSRLLTAVLLTAIIAATIGVTPMPARANGPTARTSDVRIDTSCDGNACAGSTIADSNTTRKVAVSPAGTTGTIFVAFRANDGIHVATSTDRGATFTAPIRVTTTDSEPSIAATEHAVYVAWSEQVNGAPRMLVSRGSLDGQTWTSTTDAGDAPSPNIGSNRQHIAAESGAAAGSDRVYLIDPTGLTVLRSTDGAETFASTSLGAAPWVFADVQVDPRTGDVYALVDRPEVSLYRSTDQAANFGAEVVTGASIFFSVSALTSTATQTLLYAVGSGTNFERFLLPAGTRSTTTVLPSGTEQGRSVAADGDGTVVIGLNDAGTLKFQVSADFGVSFSSAYTLASGDRTIAAINPVTGDLLLLYEASGQVLLTVYGIDAIREAAPNVGGLDGSSGGGGGGSGTGGGADDPVVLLAVEQAAGLSGTSALLVRGGTVVPTTTTPDGAAGQLGGVVITDQTGTLRVTIAGDRGVNPTSGVTVTPDGEIFCEICARLAAGSVVEAWIYSTPRLAAAVRVDIDIEEGVCPFLRIPIGGPLDGAGAIPLGAHTLQLRMQTDDGLEVLAIPITIGGSGGTPASGTVGSRVPTRVNTGGGPVPVVPFPLGITVALAAVLLLVVEQRRTVAFVTGMVDRGRIRARHAPERRLTGFDALGSRLDELRSTLR
jgi:hypothetical protein